jgi:hypothetical protein
MPQDLRAIARQSYPCAIISSSDKRRQNDGDANVVLHFAAPTKLQRKTAG